MKSQNKTKIYEDQTYFGGYLKATDEKAVFIEQFVNKSKSTPCESLLDLGCFSGDLTLRIARALAVEGRPLKYITAVEPAQKPLEQLRTIVEDNRFDTAWELFNLSMEEYLSTQDNKQDWVVASHSLYWMKEPLLLLDKIAQVGRRGALVMRDPGMLYQVEAKFRPLMTTELKRQYNSQDLEKYLTELNISFEKTSFAAGMHVPPAESAEFIALAGFLLDLQEAELRPDMLSELYADMNVHKGIANYGIDILWFKGRC